VATNSESERGQRKVATAKSEVVAKLPLACADERAAVEFMEEQRWGGEVSCPKCGVVGESYQMRDRKTGERQADFRWRCKACKKQFTVRVGTILEDSPIPLRHWCYAFWAACASKKGISSKQIERMTGLSYKSALFMTHRIRWAMAPDNESLPPLTGTVEADETYVGGKPRHPRREPGRPRKGIAPDFKDRKTPVIAAVQRGGGVHARVVTDVTPITLHQAVREMVDTSARLMTDERQAYKKIGRDFAGGHHTVRHGIHEYARGDVTTNTIESFFAILKRGIVGTYHAVSKKHLHRYVNEFAFKYNTRGVEDRRTDTPCHPRGQWPPANVQRPTSPQILTIASNGLRKYLYNSQGRGLAAPAQDSKGYGGGGIVVSPLVRRVRGTGPQTSAPRSREVKKGGACGYRTRRPRSQAPRRSP
jgi:transposase-like protein